MYCTQRQWCEIVIRAKNIYIERVYFQNEFWIKVLLKLEEFNFTAILPELASPLGSKAVRQYVNPQTLLKLSGEKHLLHYNYITHI